MTNSLVVLPNSKSPGSAEQLRLRNISTDCPYCGDRVALVPCGDPVNTNDASYFIALCPNHRRQFCKPIFAVYRPYHDTIVERYPIRGLDVSTLDKAIPESIREDYAESGRCLSVFSCKAVVVMCRRTLEAVACDKLEAKAKDANGKTFKLHRLIDLLQAEGFITKDLSDSAHEVRHFGNYGAHVQDDGLNKVEVTEAKTAREITWQFLYFIYVAPARTNELRSARLGKATASP